MTGVYNKMEKIDILLINPPFGNIGNPYISIPVLAAYLRSKGLSVSAFDLNREFFVRLLTPENIRQGKEFAVRRFKELNDKPELTFSEIYQYCVLLQTLVQAEGQQAEYGGLFLPFTDFSYIQRSRAKDLFIQMATFPFFPETIGQMPKYYVTSKFDRFSSRDIIKSTRHRSFYTELFGEIIKELLTKTRPRIIGFSVVFQYQAVPAFQCAAIVKKCAPHIHITMGGGYISIFMRELKEKKIFSIVDSLIMDEGEIPLERLCKELSGKQPDLSKVPGLRYLTGESIRGHESAPPLDMEKSPPPDYSLFQLDRYLASPGELRVPFRLSKGCFWKKCSFCRTYLPMIKYNQQPAYANVYDKLVQVIEDTGIREFIFSDEAAHPRLLEYISRRLIKDSIKIKWMAHTRIDKTLTKERCQLYAESGCERIALGIETLNNRLLKLMKKGITAELVEEVLNGIDGAVPMVAYMIIGFPTETEEEAYGTHAKVQQFIKKGVLSYCIFNLFSITYGSDMWEHPGQYGITDIVVPAGQDLVPDIYDFKSSGMSRAKAYQLMFEFSKGSYKVNIGLDMNKLKINNETIYFRYPLKDLFSRINAKWDFVLLPFARWLAKWNRHDPPLKASPSSFG